MSVADSIKAEKMFFSTSPIYSSLPPQCLGTTALVNSLTKVLESNITQFLPELLEQVKQRKNGLHDMYIWNYSASSSTENLYQKPKQNLRP
jgi:hypothetical protein